MSIKSMVEVTLAEVEVNDAYEVELSTPSAVGLVTALTPGQAVALADDLREAAREAYSALDADMGERRARVVPSTFDVDSPVGPTSGDEARCAHGGPVPALCADCRRAERGRRARDAGWTGIGPHPDHHLIGLDGGMGECSCGSWVALS